MGGLYSSLSGILGKVIQAYSQVDFANQTVDKVFMVKKHNKKPKKKAGQVQDTALRRTSTLLEQAENERKDYASMKNRIESDNKIEGTDLDNIMRHMKKDRTNFSSITANYAIEQVALKLLKICRPRKRDVIEGSQADIQGRIGVFEHAQRKFRRALDAVEIIKAVQQIKLLREVLLNDRQKVLMAFQRSSMVEREDNTESSDDFTKLVDSDREMPGGREATFNKLREVLDGYQNQEKLDGADRILLKGFYTNTRSELEIPTLLPKGAALPTARCSCLPHLLCPGAQGLRQGGVLEKDDRDPDRNPPAHQVEVIPVKDDQTVHQIEESTQKSLLKKDDERYISGDEI